MPWENRFGTRIGVQRYGEIFYLAATPTFNGTFRVGPKDLLRAMGYTEYGYPIKMQKWDPGAREGCHPRSCLRTPLPAPRRS